MKLNSKLLAITILVGAAYTLSGCALECLDQFDCAEQSKKDGGKRYTCVANKCQVMIIPETGGGDGSTGGGDGTTGGGDGTTGGGDGMTGGGDGTTGGGTATGGGDADAGTGGGMATGGGDADAGTGGGTATGGGTGADAGDTDAGMDMDAGMDTDAGAIDDGGMITLPISLADLAAAGAGPSAGSSWGTVTTTNAYDSNGSLTYVKTSADGGADKFELYIIPVLDDGGTPAPFEALHARLGDYTINDIQSFTVHSRRNDATTPDFTLIVYTVPTGTGDDASWYHHRLHSVFSWAAPLNAPALTWNAYSTNAGDNQLQFWDFRNSNLSAGDQPNNNFFTLADMQAGPVQPTGLSTSRDYGAEVVKFFSLSTFSTDMDVNASIDGIELQLKDGRGVTIDFKP